MATDMHYGASKNNFSICRSITKKYDRIRKSGLGKLCKNQLGARIRRQHPIWEYVADYYCHELKLVIEIDGEIHLPKEIKEYDINRDVTLTEYGIEMRFTNDEVINGIDKVIEEIKRKIEELRLNKSKEARQVKPPGTLNVLATKRPKPLMSPPDGGDLGAICRFRATSGMC